MDENIHLYQPLDPNNPWENEGFYTPNIWVINPQKMRVVGSHGIPSLKLTFRT